MQVNILEAKNRLSELVKSAEAGEEVIIANRGKPVVRLVPVANNTKHGHPVGSADALRAFLASNAGYKSGRTKEEIDAEIEELRASWD